MIEYTHVVASIDPDHPVPLAGRAGEARITKRVHDPLEANILAIFDAAACNAVLISIDAVFVGRELSDALLEACTGFGVNAQSVLIVASHTHSAPALENTKPLLGVRCDDDSAEVNGRSWSRRFPARLSSTSLRLPEAPGATADAAANWRVGCSRN